MSRLAPAAPPADAAAFCEFLTTLAEAVKLRMNGDALAAGLTQMTAAGPAYKAFPFGSPESGALGILLASALQVTAEVTP